MAPDWLCRIRLGRINRYQLVMFDLLYPGFDRFAERSLVVEDVFQIVDELSTPPWW